MTWGSQAGRVLAVSAVCAVCSCVGAANAWARSVHIRGTAYEFNNAAVRLGGATVRVAERPRIRATVRRDGSYDLVVPDRANITPYITATGYHTIYLQTFRTAGEDLARVNFQTPRESIYRALAALLEVPLDENGELRQCGIVSTFNTRNVRDLSFGGFTRYGAHGVAGATAFATPALPPPVYFNEDVIPDPLQQLSSIDGGVIWTRVPNGVFRITARHPATRFASFVATCKPGRVVNANPPWGLHELGKRNTARVSVTWSGTQLRRFRVTDPPAARDRPAQLLRQRLSLQIAQHRERWPVHHRPARRSRTRLAAGHGRPDARGSRFRARLRRQAGPLPPAQRATTQRRDPLRPAREHKAPSSLLTTGLT